MNVATIVPEPGKLKDTLRKLNALAGGHADATVDGSYEITVPEWLADLYNQEDKPPAPKRRGRPKKIVEDEQ